MRAVIVTGVMLLAAGDVAAGERDPASRGAAVGAPPRCENAEVLPAIVPSGKSIARPRSLDRESLGRREKAVERRFNGCVRPMIVEAGVGREQR